jgi:hypothetical protein
MNLIQFRPVDNDVALLGNAIRILNDFKTLGFIKRDAFIEVVLELDPHYNEFSRIQKLMNFWSGRVKDENLNKDLDKVIEKLKSE